MKTSSLETLTNFRKPMYQLFTRRRDAFFDLTDALLTTGPVLSPAHLSLAAGFQRSWGSIYDALVDGQIDSQAVETLLAQHPLEAGEPIFAVDASVWARCDGETGPERAFYHHPSRHSAGQPIVAGWAYHWIAQVSFAHDSWTAPQKIRRLQPMTMSMWLQWNRSKSCCKTILKMLRCPSLSLKQAMSRGNWP
jgi:hypothetical protein